MDLLTRAITVLFLATLVFSDDPENAGTSIASYLEVCYNDTRLLTRDYRLPATITTLIEVIRKIEDGSPSINARELAVQLLQRFRQDGIIKTFNGQVDSSIGIPYSPRGMEVYKNRYQLKVITPPNTVSYDSNILSPLEACSLHFMVSGSVETQERGDEGTVCNQLSRYTSRLDKREVELTEQKGRIRTASTCPIESGVVWTKWGAVKPGTLIAGIASGLVANNIPTTNGTLIASYASTLAGELSEVALYQSVSTKVVGNKGSWNDTVEPKYYFLESNDKTKLLFTDAEIKSSIDGLVLALGMPSWNSNNIKISQVLDLYYGRGVYNSSTRACNRKSLIQNLISDKSLLISQTTLFNYELDKYAQMGFTANKANFPTFAENAVNSFISYIGNNLNDLDCSAELDIVERIATDVVIIIDTAWEYQMIQPFVSYILQNIDVNKFESSYSIYDGVNINPIVNKTRSILDFYEKYNASEQLKYATGFEYNKVYDFAENIFRAKLNNETDLTGQSTILLLLPKTAPSLTQTTYASEKRNNVFKQYLPDLRIIVGAPGSKTSYNDLVTNPTSDIIVLPDSYSSSNQNSVKEVANVVIDRFQKIPRAVINPRCGSSFSTSERSNLELTQYVEPTGINYYKISPNYFYQAGYLKIRPQSSGTIIVCTSRTDPNIRQNTTGADCQTTSSNEVSKDISTYCTDSSVSNCSPIYVSVEATTATQARCTEKTCRFPDSVKYQVVLENVGCNSSAVKILGSIGLSVFLFFVLRF